MSYVFIGRLVLQNIKILGLFYNEFSLTIMVCNFIQYKMYLHNHSKQVDTSLSHFIGCMLISFYGGMILFRIEFSTRTNIDFLSGIT